MGSCQDKYKGMKKYAWSAAISAPKLYPIEVIRGSLGNDEYGAYFSTIYGINNPGWGNAGRSMDNSSLQYLPDTLSFTWYSIVEDKYFTGKWGLDIAYLNKVFKEKYENIFHKSEQLYKIVIGLGPKGKVVMWGQSAGTSIELGSFQAQDTIITAADMREDDQHRFVEGRRERILRNDFYIPKEARERISEVGYPNPDLYSLYQKRYDWNVKINHIGEPNDLRLFYFNGEMESRIYPGVDNPFFKRRSIINRLAYFYIDEEKKRGLGIHFNSYEELSQAFERLSMKAESIELVVDVDLSTLNSGRVFLKNSQEKIELKEVVISNSYTKIK
ncbi:DUF2931 family protein [Sphingobacterium sp. WQ 366]|uniref:DUF2931 family protein n=2 Tax=Sphingobacterium bovistauri TaxID=2781959 RepID=A0ABS7Z0L5_9SPHI|nr:DUF2931 family protein [Sphingobacterium bovistauri]